MEIRNLADLRNSSDDEIDAIKLNLFSSLLYFTRFFYLIRYNRQFIISNPPGRLSHYVVFCDALEDVYKGNCNRLMLEAPPRYGKTELLINFAAWSLAWNPSSNYIYTSYGKTLSVKCTSQIKDFICHPVYQYLFNVRIKSDTSAKDHFKTTAGGEFYGVGAEGSITGNGAGIFGSKEYAGNIFVDDILKPKEALSDVIRESRNTWYFDTLLSRLNDPEHTPIIVNNQRTNEYDLSGALREKDEGKGRWRIECLPALDGAGNALCPEKHTVAQLLELKELNPYVFASQYQQSPQPDGGAIFKEEWFPILDEEPKILLTFITGDTAETKKTFNCPTVFSFFGIYKIERFNLFAIHWIDCIEVWVEPVDLEKTFFDFYDGCMRHPVQPSLIGIEKKSTGVTLLSVLSKVPGLNVIDIERNSDSGSKPSRFLDCQPIVAQKRVSFTQNARHVKKCIDHCKKLVPNGSHRWADIGDTLADGIDLALIKNHFKNQLKSEDNNKKAMLDVINTSHANITHQRRVIYGRR